MLGVSLKAALRGLSMAGTGLAVIGAVLTSAPGEAAAQKTHEVTVTVTRFKALDRADELSRGDFFARVTINGKSKTTDVISDKEEVSPKNWELSTSVPPGVHNVKLELIDKDLSVDDPIDINRIAKQARPGFHHRHQQLPHRRLLAGIQVRCHDHARRH